MFNLFKKKINLLAPSVHETTLSLKGVLAYLLLLYFYPTVAFPVVLNVGMLLLQGFLIQAYGAMKGLEEF